MNSPPNRRIFQYSLASLLLLLTFAAVGVGVWMWVVGRPEPTALSGTVTFKGQPIPAGTITLWPESNTLGRQPYQAAIKNGRYSFPPDRAVPSGTYSVVIAKPQTAPAATRPSKAVLKIELTPGIHRFDFDLTRFGRIL